MYLQGVEKKVVQSIYMKEDSLTRLYYDYAMAAPLMVEGKRPQEVSTYKIALECIVVKHIYKWLFIRKSEECAKKDM